MTNREVQLDAVRGLAIVLAMGWHLNNGADTSAFMDVLLFPGRSFGWAGVDLFFVLSGFLVGRLVLSEIQLSDAFDYRRFLVRRGFRLWPVLYVYLAAQLIVADDPWQSYFFQVFLHVQNYAETPLAHLWSLAVEEHFYLALGILMPLLIRWRASARTLAFSVIGLMATAWALRSAGLAVGVDPHDLQVQTQYRVDALGMGLLIAIAAVHFPVLFERLKQQRLILAAAGILGFALLTVLGDGISRVLVGYTVAYLASAALILSVDKVHVPRAVKPIVRALAFLGLYSYSLYIWHNGLGNVVAAKVASVLGITWPDAVVVMKYGASIVGAVVVSKLIEMPMINLRDRLFPSARSKTAREASIDEAGGTPRAETA